MHNLDLVFRDSPNISLCYPPNAIGFVQEMYVYVIKFNYEYVKIFQSKIRKKIYSIQILYVFQGKC